MRHTVSQDPNRQFDPNSMHSLGYTLVSSALMVVAIFAMVLAASYPTTAMGVGALAIAGWLAARTLRRFRRTRRRDGRTRRVCFPTTDVCVEL